MKTLFIYSDFKSLPKYFIKEGDYRHLNNTVLNSDAGTNSDELTIILYGKYGDAPLQVELKEFNPNENVEVDYIVNVGFAL